MPYRRSYSRGRGSRRSYGVRRGQRSYSKTNVRKRRSAPRQQTIRIVVEQPGDSAMLVNTLGQKQKPPPRRARF